MKPNKQDQNPQQQQQPQRNPGVDPRKGGSQPFNPNAPHQAKPGQQQQQQQQKNRPNQ